MAINTRHLLELTSTAIELLRSLDKATTAGIQATSLTPDPMSSEYDLLIAAELIEVRNIATSGGRFAYQSLPHVFIRPAGIELLRKLDGIEPRK